MRYLKISLFAIALLMTASCTSTAGLYPTPVQIKPPADLTADCADPDPVSKGVNLTQVLVDNTRKLIDCKNKHRALVKAVTK